MEDKILKKAISILTLITFLFTNVSYGAVESRSLFKNKKVNHQNLSMQNEESLRKRQSVLKGEEDRSEEQKKEAQRILSTHLQDISQIHIPSEIGRVIEAYQAPSKESRTSNDPSTSLGAGEPRLIVHIQDLHTNPEAEYNLAKILEILLNDYKMGLICSEGADGVVDTSSVSSFPDYDTREKVAKIFVNSGELTGEEYLSITKYPELPIWGIENRDIYFENIIQFNKIMKFNPQSQVFISQAKKALEQLKPKIYSKELLQIDQKETDYEAQRLETADYLKYLLDSAASQSRSKNISGNILFEQALDIEDVKGASRTANYRNISILMETIELEKKIDQQKIMQESQNLILNLQSAISAKSLRSDMDSLMVKAQLFKEQKISPFSFYSYLKDLANKHLKDEFSIKYASIDSFIDYLTKVNSVDSTKLFIELEDLSFGIKQALSGTQEQKTLTEALRNIKFLEGFFNLKISNEELDYYLENKESHKVGWFKSAITNLTNKTNSTNQTSYIDFNPDLIDNHLSELEDFYKIVKQRDIAMVNNSASEIEKRNSRVSTLVAGGFHTKGITKLLKEKGYSYIVVSPYSKTEIDEENYHFLLSGRRKPIEELLQQLDLTDIINGLSASLRVPLVFSGLDIAFNENLAPQLATIWNVPVEQVRLSDIAERIGIELVAATAGNPARLEKWKYPLASIEIKASKEQGVAIVKLTPKKGNSKYFKVTKDTVIIARASDFEAGRAIAVAKEATKEKTTREAAVWQQAVIPAGFMSNLWHFGLAVAGVQFTQVYGEQLESKTSPLDTIKAQIALEVANAQALAGATHSGTGRTIGKDKKAIDAAKAVADGNAVTHAIIALEELAKKYNVCIVVIGNEGKDRDKAPAIKVGRIFNPEGKSNGVLLFINDAIECTNNAFNGDIDSYSFVGFADPGTPFEWDGYRVTVSFRSDKPAIGIDPVIKGNNTVEVVLKKIAKSKGYNDDQFGEFCKNHKVVFISRGRHKEAEGQAKKLQERYGLAYTSSDIGYKDGDFMPRLSAALGEKVDGRESIVLLAGGGIEHFTSLLAAAALTTTEERAMLAEDQAMFGVSVHMTKKGMGESDSTVDLSGAGYDEGKNFTPEEIGQRNSYDALAAKINLQLGMPVVGKMGDLGTKITEGKIPGSPVVAVTTITGVRPDINGQRMAELLKKVEFLPDGTIILHTLIMQDSRAFIIRTTFKTNDIALSLGLIRLANIYARGGDATLRDRLQSGKLMVADEKGDIGIPVIGDIKGADIEEVRQVGQRNNFIIGAATELAFKATIKDESFNKKLVTVEGGLLTSGEEGRLQDISKVAELMVTETKENAEGRAARKIADLIKAKNEKGEKVVIGFATGGTYEGIYARLIEITEKENISWENVVTFNLDEYVWQAYGYPAEYRERYYDKESYRGFMYNNLFNEAKKQGLKEENIHLMDGLTNNPQLEAGMYEDLIKKETDGQGVDLQVLGIGVEGHIAFIEARPGMPLEKFLKITTKDEELDQSTLEANARFFDNNISAVPTHAMTQGIATISKAKYILLVGTGPKKTEAITKTVAGEVTPAVPASVLQLHPNATIIVDENAARGLIDLVKTSPDAKAKFGRNVNISGSL